MPNHITNELTADKHVINSLKRGELELDFETVAPIPEVFKGKPSGMVVDWANITMGIVNLKTLLELKPDPVAAVKSWDYKSATLTLKQSTDLHALHEGPFPINWSNEDFEQLIGCMRGLKEHGHASWYEWCIENWGTKWNAYKILRVSETVVKFQTAWSAPLPLLDKLCKKFPDSQIKLRWADEDFGNNTGCVLATAKWGGVEFTGGLLENGSPKAHALAMELIHEGIVPSYMKLEVDGRYSYLDDNGGLDDKDDE